MLNDCNLKFEKQQVLKMCIHLTKFAVFNINNLAKFYKVVLMKYLSNRNYRIVLKNWDRIK